MSSSTLDEDQTPVDVQVDDQMIRVRFSGGLELATPVSRFPRLHHATASQRARWELAGRGLAIHWPDVDEDISVKGLFATQRRLPESTAEQIPVLISDLLRTTKKLNALFTEKPFTAASHLIAGIAEVVAEYVYDLRPADDSPPRVDAHTCEEPARTVQVQLTGERGQHFSALVPASNEVLPDLLLCMRLTTLGFEEIYNGVFPAHLLQCKPALDGLVRLEIPLLQHENQHLLLQKRSFDAVNRWFKAAPELAGVA